MAQYRLYTGGPYKQNNGSAITSTSTDISVGAAKGIKDSEILNKTENSSQVPSVPDVSPGVDGVAPADTESFTTIDSFAATSDGLVECTFSSAHGLSIGDVVCVNEEAFPKKVYRVVRVTGGTTAVINEQSSSAITSLLSISSTKNSGVMGEQGAENFIMKKNDATVHGEAAPAEIVTGSSDTGNRRKVAKHSDTIRTRKVATAIRLGKYDIVSGEFDSGYPASSNDAMNSDDETVDSTTKIGVKGELTFKHSGAQAASKDYEAKND
jgi:hypothetical protein